MTLTPTTTDYLNSHGRQHRTRMLPGRSHTRVDLESGVYIIKNVKNRNWAVALNDTDGGDVVAGSSADKEAGEKWAIELLSNGNYLLRNHRYEVAASYIDSDLSDKMEARVRSMRTPRPREWQISRQGDAYKIYTIDGKLCWDLQWPEAGTSVLLWASRRDDCQRWEFVKDGAPSGPFAANAVGSRLKFAVFARAVAKLPKIKSGHRGAATVVPSHNTLNKASRARVSNGQAAWGANPKPADLNEQKTRVAEQGLPNEGYPINELVYPKELNALITETEKPDRKDAVRPNNNQDRTKEEKSATEVPEPAPVATKHGTSGELGSGPSPSKQDSLAATPEDHHRIDHFYPWMATSEFLLQLPNLTIQDGIDGLTNATTYRGSAIGFTPGNHAAGPMILDGNQPHNRTTAPNPWETPSPPNLAPQVAIDRGVLSPADGPVNPDYGGVIAPDEPCVVNNGEDGSVLAGTLRGLVTRLISDTPNFSMDVEFREVFLSSHRAFAKAQDVYRLLVHQFHETYTNSCLSNQVRIEMLYRIINVLKTWLENHPTESFGVLLLEEMRTFAGGIQMAAISALTDELGYVIERLINTAHECPVPSPIDSLSPRSMAKSGNITPANLAIALTIMENDNYHAIRANDCFSHLLEVREPPNKVSSVTEMSKKISNWVKGSVIRSSRLEKRGETLVFFVNTAKECWRLNNFSSMATILLALESVTITRLGLTKECLDRPAQQTLKRLTAYVSPLNNHHAYREILNNRMGPCVPWFAVHLQELTLIYRSYAATVKDKDGGSLINFERYQRAWENIRDFLQYNDMRSYDFEKHRNAGPLAYLVAALGKTGTDDATEEAIDGRSKEVQKQESALGVRAAGFAARIPD